MARYFFHTANGRRRRDVEGLDLATVHAAELEAVRFLADLLSEKPEEFRMSRSLTVTVADLDGCVAFSVRANLQRPRQT